MLKAIAQSRELRFGKSAMIHPPRFSVQKNLSVSFPSTVSVPTKVALFYSSRHQPSRIIINKRGWSTHIVVIATKGVPHVADCGEVRHCGKLIVTGTVYPVLIQPSGKVARSSFHSLTTPELAMTFSPVSTNVVLATLILIKVKFVTTEQ